MHPLCRYHSSESESESQENSAQEVMHHTILPLAPNAAQQYFLGQCAFG